MRTRLKLIAFAALLVIAGYANAQVNLTDSLIAYLPLNGNGNDVSGNGNNATVSVNGVYPTRDRLSNENSAMLFNGAIENGMLDFGTPLLNGRSEFSMSFWFNPASLTNGMSLVGQDNILETGFYTGATRVIVFHPTSGGVNVNLSQGVGVWQHLAVTTSATQMRIYLNGILVDTRNGNYTLASNTTNTRIGGNVVNVNNNSWFRGSIDEVRFYNRVITQDEVDFLSSSGSYTLNVGSISPTTYCAGAPISIPFTALGTWQSSNVFTAQLSDENGNFTNATNIGSLTSVSASTINATLPSNLAHGTGYKLRIVSSLPQIVGATSTATLTINNASESLSTLSRGRILWYKFDGNVADSSGNNLTGTLVGGTSYTTDRFGNATRALQLNGTNGHVVAPAGVYFDGSPFAVSCWIRPNAYNNWSRVIDFCNGGPGDNVVLAFSNGTSGNLHADIRVGTGAANAIASSIKPPLNEWSHVVFMHDGTNGFIYLNGNLVNSGAIPLPRMVRRVNAYIGRSGFSNDAYANAAYDDFMIYNRALTVSEIKTLAADGIVHFNITPCVGSALELSAPLLTNATYQWSGPNSFSSTQRENTILNTTTANSGNYSVTITQGACTFSQTRNIAIINPATQPTINFSGLPDTTYVGRSPFTLTGTPTGGFFTGPGVQNANQFNPTTAGVGTHTVFYQVQGTGGCLTTVGRTVVVLPGYNMQNAVVTSCGGSFYDSGSGTANYQPNENFTMTFCSDNGLPLRFNFSAMSLGTGDTLWAYDGNSINGKLLGMYIPNSRPDIIWSDTTCITFRFRSNASNETSGWIATYSCLANPAVSKSISLSAGINVVCDGKVYDPAGTGNYGYGFNVQTFKSRNGERLRMDVFEFNINFNNGGHWLRVYDGPSTAFPSLGQWNSCCAPPSVFISSGEFLTVEFDANNTNAGVGSRAGFGMDISCFGTPLIEYVISDTTTVNVCEGAFYDSGGPNANYNNNELFTKTFCSDNGQLLRFDFNRHTTQFGAGDTLWAFDGNNANAPLLGMYISAGEINPIKASGSCITFRFRSNNTGVGRGWQAFVSCVAVQSAQDTIFTTSGLRTTCNAIIEDDSKEFPYGYGYQVQTYKSSGGQRLRFQYTLFQINGNNGGHWLRIYDGPSTAHPLIGAYNNFNFIPASVESTGEFLTFEFDHNNTAAGVGTLQGYRGLLTCTTPALTTYNMGNGTITTCDGVFYDNNGPAANYSDNQNLVQTFCSANGQLLQISFNVNETAFNTGDTLWAFDGSDVNAPPLAMYIQGSRIETLTSSGTCLTFRFVSNATTNSRGWQGVIRCVNTPPANTVYTMSSGVRYVCSGTFLDPGGTGNYSVGAGQVYNQTFTSYSGQRLRATVNSININGNNGGHWLRVYDGPSTASPLIGSYNNFNGWPPAFQSTGSSLTFRFEATNTNAGSAPGFDIRFSCFTGSPIDINGTLSSPVCQGRTLQVPFILNDTVGTNNTYTAQLSDSLGNFTNPVNIGTLTSNATSGTINATIPVNTPPANGYRVRVNSSVPVQLGSASPNTILVLRTPTQPANISVSGSTQFCNSVGTATLSIPNQSGVNYQWFRNDTIPVGGNSNTHIATEIGVYRVQLSNGCDTILSTASVTISTIVSPTAPTITANGNTTFCTGGSVQLSIPTQAGMNYQWKRNSNNVGTNTNTFTATLAGDYTVVVSNACGNVTSVNTITVVITGSAPTVPSITATGATTFCNGDSVQLSIPTQAGVTYQWKLGGNNIGTNSNVFFAKQSGVYTVQVSNGCGSQNSSNSITVTVNTPPTAPSISANGNTTFCSGGSVQLSVPTQSGVNYQWKNGANNVGGNSNILTVTLAGTYTIQLTNSCGTVTSTNSITVSISGTAPTVPTITANGATSFCAGDSVTLSIPTQTGVTYQWKNGANNVGTNSNTFVAKVAGTYTVEVSNNCGTQTSSNSIAVSISGSAPTVPAISANGNTTFCVGGSVQLSVPAQTGVNYQWKNGANNVGTNSNTFTASAVGTYTIELSNNCGTVVSSNSITVTISGSLPTVPTITAAGNTTICSSTSVALNVPQQTGVTYQWKRGTTNVGTNSNSFNANVAGTYTVELTNNCGTVVSSNSITVTVTNPPSAPTITTNGNTSFCSGGSVQLSVPTQTGVSYQWKNGSTNVGGNSNTFTASAAGTYTVELTNSCGTTASSNSVTVTVLGSAPTTPTIAANGATSFCSGDSVILSVANQAGATFQWKNGANNVGTNSNTFVAKQAGVYTVQVSNACGNVTSANSVTVTISGSAPTVPVITANGPTAICSGGSVQLSIPAQSGVNYQWKNGTNNVGGNNNTLTVSGSGNFTVVLSNTCGTVTSSNSISVTVVGNPPSAPTITPNGNVNFCQGGGVALEVPAQAGVDYQWKQGNNNVGTNSPSLTVTTAGTFSVVVSNGCGSVSSTNTITTTVNQLPATPAITANGPTTFCNGNVQLSATPGFNSYEWNNGQITQSILVTTSGTYNVVVTDLNGCQSGVSNSITVNVGNATVFSSINASICSNESYNFGGNTITQQGVYTDTLVTAGGCDSIVTLTLTVNAIIVPVVTNALGVLSTDIFYDSYQWQLNGVNIPGEDMPILFATQSGVYTVVVTQGNCSAVSNAVVINTVGVHTTDESLSFIKMYPNPANDFVIIESNDSKILFVEVLDISGRKVQLIENIVQSNFRIDVSGLPASTYTLRLRKLNGIQSSFVLNIIR